ncbi:hypothetical protein AF54_00925, partial [Serratia marcescens BIDMC 81]
MLLLMLVKELLSPVIEFDTPV